MLFMAYAMMYKPVRVIHVNGSHVYVNNSGKTKHYNIRPNYTQVSHHDCSFIYLFIYLFIYFPLSVMSVIIMIKFKQRQTEPLNVLLKIC